ncbi:MAG: glucosaminidase domain-containing protein [Bacteroidia bacterium]|nr:glucosaminidase domain-containing protein [Bacteroidia bacterium]
MTVPIHPFTISIFPYLPTSLLPYLTTILFLSFFSATAQTSYEDQVRTYIDTYKGIVIQDMRTYGIPASIKLAQAILESGAGQSALAKEANNHFGIKCHKEWTGKTYRINDDAPKECFRKYDHAVQSFHDHSEFLTTRDRYQFLFSIDIQNYRAWAHGLKTAGYATNPKYPNLLINIIERYSLDQYDLPEGAVAAIATTQADEDLMDACRSLFTYFAPGPNNRKVYLNNHVQCTIALENDDLLKIARDFRIKATDLLAFNDLKRAGGISTGQAVYLEKKRRKAVQKKHVVGRKQSMWEISQVYGIRLANLYRKNLLPEGFEPPAGKVLKLR